MANGWLRAAAVIATLGVVAGGLVLALERSSSPSAASAACSLRSTSFHCLLQDKIDPAAVGRTERPRRAHRDRHVTAHITPESGCDLAGSSEYFNPTTNSWWAGRGAGMLTVCAGGDAGQQADGQIHGRLLIIRSNLSGPASFKADGADVPSAGVLRIVGAPEGRHLPPRVETQANIRFTDGHGVRGTLHLRDDSVTLSP